jgi:hypothetical protein
MTDSEQPERVIEEWRLIDKWWTDAPIEREYRLVERGGCSITEWRNPGCEWQPVAEKGTP